MNTKSTINDSASQRRLLLSILMIAILLVVILDLAESKFYGSAFYISESIVFSSFWWIFLPLLWWQFSFNRIHKTRVVKILIVVVPIVVHLVIYPAVVWLLSELLFQHTYSYWQTLTYEVTEYGFVLIVSYSVPFTLFTLWKSKLTLSTDNGVEIPEPNNHLKSFLVKDNNEQILISTHDILYFSANSPYVNIHHKQKRYLQNETLKSLSQRLNDNVFIRIHKSVIVNIKNVKSYKSRLNGDYDLTMSDGTELRLSRNYAPSFKQKFATTHQDTPE